MAGTTAVGAGVAVPLGHQEAMILAATEFDRMAAQLQALAPRDWAQPTVCELWDVRAMAAHVLGMAPRLFFEPRYASVHRYLCARSGQRNIGAIMPGKGSKAAKVFISQRPSGKLAQRQTRNAL